MISRNVNHREVLLEVESIAIELGELMVNLLYGDALNSSSRVNITQLHGDDRNDEVSELIEKSKV